MIPIVRNNRVQVMGFCPVPKCENKEFYGDNEAAVKLLIIAHLKANLADANHSEIAEKEGWFDPDPLGD